MTKRRANTRGSRRSRAGTVLLALALAALCAFAVPGMAGAARPAVATAKVKPTVVMNLSIRPSSFRRVFLGPTVPAGLASALAAEQRPLSYAAATHPAAVATLIMRAAATVG
jgi:hypothetical protein